MDLSFHGVIEASAGTGKTYTIENLFIKILLERDIPINKILVVTYTEKATGELKKRIRENISKVLNDPDRDLTGKQKERLLYSLNHFDQSSISTIHGFCNDIIKEFAYEMETSYELQLTFDEWVYETQLYEIMRNNWYGIFSDIQLEVLLEVSDFPEVVLGKSKWMNLILKLAMDFKEEVNSKILPDLKSDIKESLPLFFRQLDVFYNSFEKVKEIVLPSV